MKAGDSVPRTALTREEAAASLGIGLTAFEEKVQPFLRLKRVGRRRLVPLGELRAWAESDLEPPMSEQVAK